MRANETRGHEPGDETMTTATLLDVTNVVVYDASFNVKKHGSRDKLFNTPAEAQLWIEKVGAKTVNIYRINKINGEWRTDWVVA
jgi:hypothetical protein